MPTLSLFRRRQSKAARESSAAPATPSRLPLPAPAGMQPARAASRAEERPPLFPPHPAVRLPVREPQSGGVGSGERRSLIPVPAAPKAGKAKEEEPPARKGMSKTLEDDLQKAADELEEEQLTPRALEITKTPSTGNSGATQQPHKPEPPTPTPAQRVRAASPHANLLLGGRRTLRDADSPPKKPTATDKALPPRPASAASTAARVAAQAPTAAETCARVRELEVQVQALAAIVAGQDAAAHRIQDAALESANAAHFAEEKAAEAKGEAERATGAAVEALEMAKMTTTMVENLVLGGEPEEDETF